MSGACLFDTAVGRCGVAWGDAGIRAVQLPEADDAATLARLRRRCPDAAPAEPPPEILRAIDDIAASLRGEPRDLAALPLDFDGVGEFDRRVYAVALSIPAGETLTYGEVARRLGDSGLARAVGQSLGRNPFAPVVPCHRVLAAGGALGGFSASGGTGLKARMLVAERAITGGQPSLFAPLDTGDSR